MLTRDDYTVLFEALAGSPDLQRPGTALFRAMAALCAEAFRASEFSSGERHTVDFGSFGELSFPYYRMGAIDSVDLFGLHELAIFSFYLMNRNRYRLAVDVGANLGLHTILLSRCGARVRSYEPDPVHFDLLRKNVAENRCERVELVRASVSEQKGRAEFVRVVGNTTGSHLAGAKADPYGELSRFQIDIVAFEAAVEGADFVKFDAEGHEAVILLSVAPDRWRSLDAMVEIGTPENAKAVFDHFLGRSVQLFSQKIGWAPAQSWKDLPASHREGSLFISEKTSMPWSSSRSDRLLPPGDRR